MLFTSNYTSLDRTNSSFVHDWMQNNVGLTTCERGEAGRSSQLLFVEDSSLTAGAFMGISTSHQRKSLVASDKKRLGKSPNLERERHQVGNICHWAVVKMAPCIT